MCKRPSCQKEILVFIYIKEEIISNERTGGKLRKEHGETYY